MLVLTLAWLGRVILLLLFASIVLAVLLTAILDWIKARFNLKQRAAFALFAITVSTVVVVTLWVSGPSIVEQFASLQTDLPRAGQQLVVRVQEHNWGRWLLAQWSGYSQ